MAAQIALINPRRRRKSRKTRSRKRRVVARRSPRRRRRVVARRRNPRKYPRLGYVTSRRAKIRRRKLNPRIGGGGIVRALVPAAIGGAGAVALDVGLSYVPGIPDQFRSGWGKTGLQVVGAFALGWLAKFVVSRDVARNVTMGALTVAAYSAIKNVVRQVAPNVPGVSSDENVGAYMPELGYVNPAPFIDTGLNDGVGAYMSSDGM